MMLDRASCEAVDGGAGRALGAEKADLHVEYAPIPTMTNICHLRDG